MIFKFLYISLNNLPDLNWLQHQLDLTYNQFAPLSALAMIAYLSGIALHEIIHGHTKFRTNWGVFKTIMGCLLVSAVIAYLSYLNKYGISTVRIFVLFSTISLATAYRELRNISVDEERKDVDTN